MYAWWLQKCQKDKRKMTFNDIIGFQKNLHSRKIIYEQ